MDRQRIKNHFRTDFYVTQALTGHNICNEYLNRFKIRETEICFSCPTEIDDYKHRLYSCSRFDDERQQFKEEIERSGRDWPIEMKETLHKDIFNHFKIFSKLILKNN